MTLIEQIPEGPEPKRFPKGSDEPKSSDGPKGSDAPVSKPSSSNPRGFPIRLLGSGMELASYTLILGAAGYWVDRRWHFAQPYFGIAGALVGFSLGMYRLIVLATRQG